MSLSTLFRISRPRFWHYILWPMLIYFASSGFLDEIYASWSRWGTDWMFHLIILFIILGYFTLPANLWIYGRNDIADGDTDKFNSKKWTYESKIEDTDTMKAKLKRNIWIWNIGYIIITSSIIILYISLNFYDGESWTAIDWIGLINLWISIIWIIICILLPFLITSYLYSCKPLRAKAKPFIDGIMNILYIATPFTIIIGFIILNWTISSYTREWILPLLVAALFRCMAMHCYSAIPDIEPDQQAGLNTTAVYLGKQNALIYCSILYILSAILSFTTLWWFSIVWWIIYLGVMIISYSKNDIFGLYKLFPYINLIIWFLLFRYILLYL